MQFSKKPYFMIINEWYTYDKEQGIYVLTDKATKEAKESYKKYYELLEHQFDIDFMIYYAAYSDCEKEIRKSLIVDIDKLLMSKEQLENCKETKWTEVKCADKVITLPYPMYPYWVHEIFELVEPCYTYGVIIQQIESENIPIEKLTFLQVQAMLTYIQRTERFCDGIIAKFISDMTLLRLVERLIIICCKGEK